MPNAHRDTYCNKLGEHRNSLHHRVEQVSDTKLDNIKHISYKVFGFTLSLLDFGYGFSLQSALLKQGVCVNIFWIALCGFLFKVIKTSVVNNACHI
jgi:hypothetical protein